VARANLKIRGLDLNQLLAELNEAEHKRVYFAEAFFVVLFAAFQDLLEIAIILLITSVIGIILAIFFVFLWALITFGLIMWLFIRRIHGRFTVRYGIYGILKLLDVTLTLGLFPAGTIAMLIVIWLNNRFSKKTIKQIEDIIHGHL